MTDAPTPATNAANPLLALTEAQRATVRRLGHICKWLGRATMVLGVAALLIVAIMVMMVVPHLGLHAAVMINLGVFATAGIVFLWQGTVAGDAGKAFAELDDAAFPGMVALALRKTSRYFAVDAVFVFGVVALFVLVFLIAMVAP